MSELCDICRLFFSLAHRHNGEDGDIQRETCTTRASLVCFLPVQHRVLQQGQDAFPSGPGQGLLEPLLSLGGTMGRKRTPFEDLARGGAGVHLS